jgi:hypothetical protein
MYSPSIWPGLPPPKAPNSRTSLTLVNRHTSILHFLAPFAARLKQEDMLIGMLNLRALRALEIALERCFAAAAFSFPSESPASVSRIVGILARRAVRRSTASRSWDSSCR